MKKFGHKEFSKLLLIQESILVWIITIAFLILAYVCIFKGYAGTLPWLSALPSCVWASYGVSQACYYNKSKKENTQGGIKYEMAIKDFDYQIQPLMFADSGIDITTDFDLNGPM